MRRRPQASSSSPPQQPQPTQTPSVTTPCLPQRPHRSPFVCLTLFAVLIYSSYGVYHYQFESLPVPLTADQVGKRGFSEFSARKHVRALTELGPHPVGSDAITLALQYVLAEVEEIKKTAHWEVEVEVEEFVAKTGANQMVSGLFKGKTLVYSDLSHIVVRVSPKYAADSVDNAVLVSSHIDTVFSTGGAGDCSSCVAVMLELARGVSQWAHGFKHAVIFLFNTGEEEGLSDFQVYKELAGLSGLDFAYTDNGAVYHTKNDKFELLQLGSLQHLGENMLAFLLRVAASSYLPKANVMQEEDKTGLSAAVYFDILGWYMIVYRQRFARMLYNSVIAQSLLIWTTSLLMGGYPAAVSLVLSCLSVILMWTFALSFSIIVAFIIPLISSSPVPYIANPWLVVGLFAAPALLGALTGQYLGYLVLHKYLANAYSKKKQLSPAIRTDLVKLEAERWLYKAGSIQWLILLSLGTYYRIGSSYLALAWLVPPAFAYGFLEATLSPVRLPRPLKLATLPIGLAIPVILSAGVFIRLAGTIIGGMVRFDRDPGGTPDWLGNVILAVFVAAVMCLTLVYLLSYIHLSGAKRLIILSTCAMFGLSLALVLSGTVPAFTNDTSRAVNVVHVVDTTRSIEDPRSYVSLFSSTPGKLTKEVEQIKEGFRCGRDQVFDFVTFKVKYGCWTEDDSDSGWSEADIPVMHVQSDTQGIERTTEVLIDTKGSIRWALAINTNEIRDFAFTDAGNSEELVSVGDKSNVDGWHVIQFAGGNNSPRTFGLTLFWTKSSTLKADGKRDKQAPLLKLRTDMDIVTPKVKRVLSKLPTWCSLFGKSTSPYTLAFLSSLPVDF
ncbi:hypothetical protein ACLB2K_074517 [Fragaria x ananassa]